MQPRAPRRQRLGCSNPKPYTLYPTPHTLMSSHPAPTATAPAASVPFLQRHHFLLRRLHSLTGIVPVGLFVIVHLFTNAQMIWGQPGAGSGVAGGSFQHEVDFIHSTPALLFVEIALWLSIAFHAILGIGYMTGWVPNVRHYPYPENWRYFLQRITAWIALVFIIIHIATLRWRINLVGIWNTPFFHRLTPDGAPGHSMDDVPMSLPLTAYALQYSALVVVVYLIGVSATIYHWCNGLWTAAITWGATITKGAQRRWGYVCIGLAVALTIFMLAAIIGALMFDLNTDTTPEQRAALTQIVPEWAE